MFYPRIFSKIKHIFVLTKEFIGPHGSGFIFIILFGFINGIAGSIGVGVIIPLFSLFSKNQLAGTDFITRNTEKLFSILHVPMNATFLISFMILLFVIKGFAQFFAKYNTDKIASRFEENLRKDLLEKTLHSKWSYLLNQKIGHLERILFFDINQSSAILLQIGTGILIITSFITYTFVAFKISIPITLSTLLFGGLLFPFIKPLFYKTRKISEQVSLIYKEVAHHIGENILGAKIVKITSTGETVIKNGTIYFEKLKTTRIKMSLYNFAVGSLIEPIGIAFIGVLFIISYRSPTFNIASFGVVVYLIQKMFYFIQSIQGQIQSFVSITPNMENVINYRNIALENLEINSGTDKFIFKDSLKFINVKFGYTKERTILNDISFEINKGEMVGIIGSSGAGKTTIVDLLLRLFEPQAGQIFVDDKEISKIDSEELRGNIGYVPQDVFLLNDTIENNIRFYDQSIHKDTVIQATKMANIYDFIEELPEKLNTIVGERGVKLSGGQRQRIVLARALARKPQILILDEATSAIDVESEKLIQEAIYGLKNKITILVIAHRFSTITNSDKIMVIDDGYIIERGSPSDLLKNEDSHFYKLNNSTH